METLVKKILEFSWKLIKNIFKSTWKWINPPIKTLCFLFIPLLIGGIIFAMLTIGAGGPPIYSLIISICIIFLGYTIKFDGFRKGTNVSNKARFIAGSMMFVGSFGLPLVIFEGFQTWIDFLTFNCLLITIILIIWYITHLLSFLYKWKVKNWIQPIKKEVFRWIP